MQAAAAAEADAGGIPPAASTFRLRGIQAIDGDDDPAWTGFTQSIENPSVSVDLEISDMVFPDRRDPDARLARLAGEITRHGMLRSLLITHYQMGANSLGAFLTQALANPQTSLARLAFVETPLDMEGCTQIHQVLESNIRLAAIEINRCRLSSEGCRLVCDAAARNPHIREVTMAGSFDVYQDTLAAVVGAGSKVTHNIVPSASHYSIAPLLRVNEHDILSGYSR
jgi:hypothetical protein